MGAGIIGKHQGIIFGVPDLVAESLGIERGILQSVTLKFSNEDFARASVELVPEAAKELVEKLTGQEWIICEKKP